jgi:hypothetical protein
MSLTTRACRSRKPVFQREARADDNTGRFSTVPLAVAERIAGVRLSLKPGPTAMIGTCFLLGWIFLA